MRGTLEEIEEITMNKGMLIILLVLSVLFIGCEEEPEEQTPKSPPTPIPEGILISEIPENADILFVSMRYVLDDLDCLDANYNVKKNFLNDAVCNKKIYNPDLDVLASPRQLYSLDMETGEAVQLTNIDCDFSSSKPVDSTRIMATGMCSDTDGDGLISTKDKPEIYLMDLAEKNIECLTCGLNLTSINNPDYSQTNEKIVFSAQRTEKFHNYLFKIDLDKNLEQITNSEEYMDFDCSWSEDGTKIVFNRLPKQDHPWVIPAQIWLMDADGTNQEKMTDGGPNPDNEDPHWGSYPIGVDADPDLSPDNSQIVFSRLKTGKQNEPFGVYELAIVDVSTKEITKLDSNYANMIPEWKEAGILFIRQIGSSSSVMDRKQSMYIYRDNKCENLEPEHDIFPIGTNGASWIEFEDEKENIKVLPRESKIPAYAVKMTPQTDSHPPILHSDEWEEPVPVPYPISTAGAEDSPFIMPNGDTLYFFFTPDPGIPVEKQLLDGVTGIYLSHKQNGVWGDAERVILQDSDKLSLDGCEFVQDNRMWFCSAREGYTGLHWFTAEYSGGKWANWQNADFPPGYEVGELHFSADGTQVYFHSGRAGGKGGYDIWVSQNVNDQWSEPENVSAVNSAETDGWPYLSQDGNQLWFLRTYLGSPALFRSQKQGDEWQEPEMIISQFAGAFTR